RFGEETFGDPLGRVLAGEMVYALVDEGLITAFLELDDNPLTEEFPAIHRGVVAMAERVSVGLRAEVADWHLQTVAARGTGSSVDWDALDRLESEIESGSGVGPLAETLSAPI